VTEDNELIEHIARGMFEGVQQRRFEGRQTHLRGAWPKLARETTSDWLLLAKDALTAYRNHEARK